MNYYDSEYRRQYCRERVAQIRDDYQRAQGPPTDSRWHARVAANVRSMAERVRARVPQRAAAYRS